MSFITRGDRIIEKISRTKYLKSATFLIALFEATVSPFLPEAFLLLVLAYRKDVSWKLLSLLSAFGSACGALIMYTLGHFLYESYGGKIINFLQGDHLVDKARLLFIENAFTAQFFASLTPLPDRLFSFLAGAFLVSPLIIFVATFLGRLIRIAPVAYLSFEYGDEARVYIKRHTKTVTLFLLGFILAFLIYSYIL